MKVPLFHLFLSMCLACVATASMAQVQPSRIALVIGNSNYAAVSRLPNAHRDSVAVAEALRGVGFSNVVIANDTNSSSLRRALRDFSIEAEKSEWAVIYYAGHGIEIGGINYLIPVDARLASDRDALFEAVPLEQVIASLQGAKKLRLVILDACRDNPFIKQMTRSNPSRSVSRGLAQVEPEGGTLVAYAAKAGQVALDGQGQNSPFVKALVKRISEPGLEINMVFRAVRDDVLADTNKKQEPFVYGSLPNASFYFRPHETVRAASQNESHAVAPPSVLVAEAVPLPQSSVLARGYAAIAVVPRQGVKYYGFGEGESASEARKSALRKCANANCKVVANYRPGQCAIMVSGTKQIFWNTATQPTAERLRAATLNHCERIDTACRTILQQCQT